MGVEGGTVAVLVVLVLEDAKEVEGRGPGRVGDAGRLGEGGVTSVWRMDVKIAFACSVAHAPLVPRSSSEDQA